MPEKTTNLEIQFRKSVHQRASGNTEGGMAVSRNQAKLPGAASGQFFSDRIPERI